MATRKISDLTELIAGSVASADTLLLLDNSDPTDQNKRAQVGSIFRAVPAGTVSTPGLGFEGKTSTGVFSESQGQVGLAMGDARLHLQKVGSTLNIQAKDSADTNLDFTISAQGTGKIRLGSILAINDLNFIIPNSSDETKVERFSKADMPTGVTHTYVLPSNGAIAASDTLVTLTASQTISNKTLVSPTFTGTLTIDAMNCSGNVTLGDANSDTLTVNSTPTFAAATTFSNTVACQQTLAVTQDITASGHLDMVDDKIIKLGTDDDLQIKYLNTGDSSYVTSTAANGLVLASDKMFLMNAAHTAKWVYGDATNTIIYHNDAARITTSATGINIGGAIDAVTSITGSGNITIATDKFTRDSTTGNAIFGGNITGGCNVTATSGTTFQLGSSASAKLGIGRAASTYNLEVEGSIYSTGSTIIAGNGSAGKFILQKGAAGIGLHFTDDTGTDQMVLNGSGQLGIGKTPSQPLDVSGNANIDGDVVVVTSNTAYNTGGKITAREIVLTDPQTGASTTLSAGNAGGVSRAKVYFHSFN